MNLSATVPPTPLLASPAPVSRRVQPTTTSTAPASAGWPTVAAIERTGRDTFLTVRLRDGATLVARFGGRAPIRLADPVAVSVDVAAAHVFDPVSGRALHHPE